MGTEQNFRKNYPAEYRTADGRWVRSKSEKIIADWLYRQDIRYEYERKLAEGVTCDFYLPDADTYVEYWGRDDETYKRHRAEKERFYSRHGFNLVSLDEGDLKHIDDVLRSKFGQAEPKPLRPAVSTDKPRILMPDKRAVSLIATLAVSFLVLGYSLGGLGGYLPGLSSRAVISQTMGLITTTSEAIRTSDMVTATSVTSSTASSLRKWINGNNAISYLDVKKYVGQTKTVEGTIVRTYRDEKNSIIYLDFHDPYQGYFQVVIWRTNWKNFPFAPETFYKGKEVRVTGLIKDYEGTPEIEATNPKQIEVAYMGFDYSGASSLVMHAVTRRVKAGLHPLTSNRVAVIHDCLWGTHR